MSILRCQHCGAETSNGLALCETCRGAGSFHLEWVPVYFRNLARWRPGRAGSRPVPGSRVLYSGEVREDRTGDRISDALDEALNALTTWARSLEDDRRLTAPTAEVESDRVTLLCRWLAANLTTIATLEWCGEFIRELAHQERRLRELTETAAPGWYAGACHHCGLPTYVVPGLTWVTCSGCGSTTYARDHLETILDEARGWVARPMRLAEALVALVDTELSVPRLHKRISKWGERVGSPTLRSIPVVRRLDADGDPVGPKRYRLGDVLDMLAAEGETRLGTDKVAAS